MGLKWPEEARLSDLNVFYLLLRWNISQLQPNYSGGCSKLFSLREAFGNEFTGVQYTLAQIKPPNGDALYTLYACCDSSLPDEMKRKRLLC